MAHRRALLSTLTKSLLRHGRIRTTVIKAKETSRLADRLVTLGKNGSVHARRQAYDVLQDRELVKRLFADIAPRFVDCPGGYTRVVKLSPRRGDGAPQALLEFSRLPVAVPSVKPTKAGPAPSPERPSEAPARPQEPSEAKKPKRFFEGLREWLKPKPGNRES